MSGPFQAKIVRYDELTQETKSKRRSFESILAARTWLQMGANVLAGMRDEYEVVKFLPEYLAYRRLDGIKWCITLELDRESVADYVGDIPITGEAA